MTQEGRQAGGRSCELARGDETIDGCLCLRERRESLEEGVLPRHRLAIRRAGFQVGRVGRYVFGLPEQAAVFISLQDPCDCSRVPETAQDQRRSRGTCCSTVVVLVCWRVFRATGWLGVCFDDGRRRGRRREVTSQAGLGRSFIRIAGSSVTGRRSCGWVQDFWQERDGRGTREVPEAAYTIPEDRVYLGAREIGRDGTLGRRVALSLTSCGS
jgi:hypothetical protein